jgi:hypothetical protein
MSTSKAPFVFPTNSGSAFQLARERFEKQLLLKKLEAIEKEKEIERREKERELKHQ